MRKSHFNYPGQPMITHDVYEYMCACHRECAGASARVYNSNYRLSITGRFIYYCRCVRYQYLLERCCVPITARILIAIQYWRREYVLVRACACSHAVLYVRATAPIRHITFPIKSTQRTPAACASALSLPSFLGFRVCVCALC